MMIAQPKGLFEKFDTMVRVPPVFHLQIWDSDAISADDFLGSLAINLAHFPKPFHNAKKCSLAKYDKRGAATQNIFLRNKIRGWFPCHGFIEKTIGQTGKIDLEMEILTEDQADINPAGCGLDGPQALPPPKRPDTSFSWYTNPIKAIKVILVPQLKKCCMYCCLVIVVFILIGGMVARFHLGII